MGFRITNLVARQKLGHITILFTHSFITQLSRSSVNILRISDHLVSNKNTSLIRHFAPRTLCLVKCLVKAEVPFTELICICCSGQVPQVDEVFRKG